MDTPPKYPKIESLYKRDEKGKMVFGDYSREEFDYLNDNEWEFREKIDGTNVRVEVFPKRPVGPWYRCYGRTDAAQLHPDLLEALRTLLGRAELEEVLPDGAVLYGEGIGPKIQAKVGKRYREEGHDFVLFDVRCGHYWLKQDAVTEIASSLNLVRAPIIGIGNLAGMRELAEVGFNSHISDDRDLLAEGIVARPKVEMLTRAGWPIITKLKTRDFPTP
jgi:hypothetical protein